MRTYPVRCGACQEAFSFEVEIPDVGTEQKLLVDVDCRWCQAALVIDLTPYLRPLVIMKGPVGGSLGLDLPEELAGVIK